MWKQDPNDPTKWKHYRRAWNKEKNVYEYVEPKPRKEYTGKDSVVVRVRCSGHLHTISFTPNPQPAKGRSPKFGGRFTVHHHDKEDILLEKAMARLGDGHKIRCIAIRDIWVETYGSRDWTTYQQRRRLPTELKRMIKDVIYPQEQLRRKMTSHDNNDPLLLPMIARKPRIVISLAERLLANSRYFPLRKQPQSDDISVFETEGGAWGGPDMSGYQGYRSGRSLTARIRIEEWLKLYHLGAALVEGIFIVGTALEEDQKKFPVEQHQLLVLAGKPDDIRIYTSLAVIELDPSGAWKLAKWVSTNGVRVHLFAVWKLELWRLWGRWRRA